MADAGVTPSLSAEPVPQGNGADAPPPADSPVDAPPPADISLPTNPLTTEDSGDWADDDGGALDSLDVGIDPDDETAEVIVEQIDPTEPYKSAVTFEELGLPEALLKGVYAKKFSKPSKIQGHSLPLILPRADGTRRNLIAQGHNGSGKTACFVLGMLSHVDASKPVTQALCIVPTRELARQIVDVVKELGKFSGATVFLAVKETREEMRQRGAAGSARGPCTAHVVVGTPGKLMDLVKRRTLNLSTATVCVLDEADEMVNTQGMGDQTLRIKRFLPAEVQILLFSATYSDPVIELAKKMAPSANHIWIERKQLALDKVQQYFFRVRSEAERYDVIRDIYDTLRLGQTIIFVRMRNNATRLTQNLRNDGHTVSVLTGGAMDASERDRVIDEFRTGTTKVLVTTNVLSRGVDIPAVTTVINYDLPTDQFDMEADPENYLHRIGRTGRYGTRGVAINLVHSDKYMKILRDLEKIYDKKIMQVDTVEELEKRIKAL